MSASYELLVDDRFKKSDKVQSVDGQGLKSLNKWHEHLKKYREAHPEHSLKKAMQEAAKTYKK